MRRKFPAARAAMVVALALASLTAAACRRDPARAVGTLTTDEVAALLGRPDVHVYDCNPRDVHERFHVPGARWVQFDAVTAADLPPDRDATLVFYCANEA